MKKKKTKFRLFRIEKILITIILLQFLTISIFTVFSKAKLASTNIAVEKVSKKIARQESINQSLQMKINELASLTNIQEIAKEYGLKYDNNNILVIKDN